MSAPVDVLAVMGEMERVSRLFAASVPHVDPSAMKEARAAVAELVEVAREVLSADDEALLAIRNLGVKTPPESHVLTEKLRAALAKFKVLP